jgi:hypothetical protein
MIDRAHYFFVFILIVFYFSCSDSEPGNCAGIINGSSVCGCMDSTATNYDSLSTFDDGSCEYLVNGIPVKWLRTFNFSSTDESWCVRQTSDGGFIIAGATDYTGLIIK